MYLALLQQHSDLQESTDFLNVHYVRMGIDLEAATM